MGSKRKRQAQDVLPTTPPSKKHQKATKSRESDAPVLAPTSRPFADEPKGAELKREVEFYERLGSQDASERLQAADAVVSGLIGGEGVSEAVLQRHLERRLFRGLASGRKAARLGFSVVLAEILAQLFGPKQLSSNKYKALTFDKVLDILKAKTKPEGDLSGQEERDHALGLLFGLQCFVHAKILSEDSEDRWEKIFESVLQLAKKKPWIREECGWVIIEALEHISQSQAEKMVEMIHGAGLAASPEGVGIWLTARRRFPGMKFPSKPWGDKGNPLHHLQALAKALKESSNPISNGKEEEVRQKGSWNPQLHFVWDIVMSEYIKLMKVNIDGSLVQFEHFWKITVDGKY
jgi:DNA polymerase phi